MGDFIHSTVSSDVVLRGSRDERGSALVLAIFVLVLLTGMGMALLFLSQVEVNMSRADLRSKVVFYLAEAGQEDGRAILFEVNGSGGFSDDLANVAGPNGVIDFDPEAVRAVYGPSGNLAGFAGAGDDVPLRSMTNLGAGWYTAFLTNDAVDGKTNTTDSNGRVMITGVGAGPKGSFDVVEAIIEATALFPTPPPATITLLGPNPTFKGAHSRVKTYNGEDCAGAGVPGLYAPVVGTIGAEAEAQAEEGMHENPSFTSGPYSDEDTFADLTDPTEPTVISSYGTIDPFWTNCQALHDTVEAIRAMADVVCDENQECILPSSSPSRIIFVEGDLHISPEDSGEGMLVVTGKLQFHGRASWNGMMLVVGSDEFHRNGGGNGTLSGALVVANLAGPDEIYGTADDCTGGDGGFAPAEYHESGGGNGDTIYCTSDISAAIPVRPYDIVGFRQR